MMAISQLGATKRQSGIELLRILAMLMIVAHHFVVHNGFDISREPVSGRKLFLQILFASNGKIGVAIFFVISAWFLADRPISVYSSLKRVSKLEIRILFYSLSLLAAFTIGAPHLLSLQTSIRSVAPTLTGLWWYTTSYAVFILLLPSLDQCLRSISVRQHAILAATVTIMWSVMPIFPGVKLDMNGGAPGFICLYIIVTYLKWSKAPLLTNRKAGATLVAIGAFLGYGSVLLLDWATAAIGFGQDHVLFLMSSFVALPALFVSIGLCILFLHMRFQSRAINRVASSTLGIYLIHEYPAMRQLLWTDLFNLGPWYGTSRLFINAIACVLTVFIACGVIDMVRSLIFKVSIDRVFDSAFDNLLIRLRGAVFKSFTLTLTQRLFSPIDPVRAAPLSSQPDGDVESE